MPIHILNPFPPLVHVGLAVDRLYAQAQYGSAPIERNALIDTGAHMTAIAPSIVTNLKPRRIASVPYIRPDGITATRPTYLVRLCLEPDLGNPLWAASAHWFDVVAIAAAPSTPGVDLFVGQDMLANLVLHLDGPRNRLLLMY